MIKEVLSRHEANHEVFYDVCYEWEEEFAKYFNVPRRLVEVNIAYKNSKVANISRKIKSVIRKFPGVHKFSRSIMPPLSLNINDAVSVGFIMSPITSSFCHNSNCVPIFLDIWSPEDFKSVIRQTKNLAIFYVTSRDAYNRILAYFPASNVKFMPLSVSDKYYSRNFESYRNKSVDVIQFGRKNPVLHDYMLKYAAEHKSIDYVYTGKNSYMSTKRGEMKYFTRREDFMNAIASAKVCLVGCSGIDNARPDTFGIQFVTPRFYEAAVLGCALMGRYPDNQEFRELGVKEVCPNIQSYDEFVTCLEKFLAMTPEELYAQNHDFIVNSLTSKRAQQLEQDLRAITGDL